MQDQQKQLIDKLKGSQNVLVTVSKDPSVDQLAAAIGLTLALNKLDKHATAVFSGQIPSTIEFLKPEDTLETTTDSLRDFIIALDKSKADKLRYKVEDQVVRIFITPYRTSISEQDLDFSQGDFNVDVVVALGVQDQQHIDEAIQAHGRILHDAAVAVLAFEGNPEMGTLNIVDSNASSLSEMVAGLVEALDHKLFDNQIATALLTGIVARTNRFSNDRTTPKTMSISSVLMAAGANQQLIASELETPHEVSSVSREREGNAVEVEAPPKDPGTLEINHDNPSAEASDESIGTDEEDNFEVGGEKVEEQAPQVEVSEDGQLIASGVSDQLPEISGVHATDITEDDSKADESERKEPIVTRERIIEPPSRDSLLSANTQREEDNAAEDDLTAPATDLPLLTHEGAGVEGESNADELALPELELPSLPSVSVDLPALEPALPDASMVSMSSQPVIPLPGAPSEPGVRPPEALFPQPAHDIEDTIIDTENETLSEIEQSVHSAHAEPVEGAIQPAEHISVDQARDAVVAAFSAADATQPPSPIAALNAQPLGPELHPDQNEQPVLPPQSPFAPMPGSQPDQPQNNWANPADRAMDMPLPPSPASSFPGVMPQQSNNNDSMLPPPPPVPPPPIFPS